MSSVMYVGTANGVMFAERQGKGSNGWNVTAGGLDGQHVTCLVARDRVLLAGTTDGIFRSSDNGHTWRPAGVGLTNQHVRWMAWHPAISGLAFAGTEPADIFLSQDGGETWRECPEVVTLREANRWSLPYSPEAGCVRGFAFQGQRAYAAVEVGGVLCSNNGGETWRLVEGSNGSPSLSGPPEPLIYPDVHSIATHEKSPDLIYAPTGGGLYRSSNGGKTWQSIYDCYCRAIWVDPVNPDHLILGPADGVSEDGRIEESRDGGATWKLASHQLKVPWPDHMVERFSGIDDELFAVLSNGRVLAAPVTSLSWSEILPEVEGVTCVTTMAGMVKG